MKKCIWCLKDEENTNFRREAHIFPRALGGNRICDLVCDNCNSYFGSKQAINVPSVEIALKEPLNISRSFLLHHTSKGKPSLRFKSEYFDYNAKLNKLNPKYKYRIFSEFQFHFVKQFKRGVYKVFLEERSQSCGDAFNEKFDFIREFARYGIGDYPVYYFTPTIKAIF